MNRKIIVLLLLLSTLLACLAGCGPAEEGTTSGTVAENDTTTQTQGGGTVETPEPIPEGYNELAYMSKTTLQIVYNIDVNDRMKASIEEMASVINKTASAEVALKHDSEAKPTNHEIRIGKVKHAGLEGMEIYKEEKFSDLGDNDFIITHRDGVIYIYANTDLSLQNAMLYFAERTLYLNEKQRYVGIPENYEQIYREITENVVEYTGADETYLYFTTHKGSMSETYVRISFTGDKAWRIQTKLRKDDTFNDIGASQRLSLVMKELPVLNTGEIYTVGTEGLTLEGYQADLKQLPLFYNMNNTSTTAEELLPGITEILGYINSIDCSAFYQKTGTHP